MLNSAQSEAMRHTKQGTIQLRKRTAHNPGHTTNILQEAKANEHCYTATNAAANQQLLQHAGCCGQASADAPCHSSTRLLLLL